MNRIIKIAILLCLFCGCEHGKCSRPAIVDGVELSVVDVAIPYKLDYHRDIGWLGKSPWNQELDSSDEGVILPFGEVCANMPSRTENLLANVEISSLGYTLRWWPKANQEVLTYLFGKESNPKAYKLTMENKQSPGRGGLLCESIPLTDAVSGVADKSEQFVIFTKEGIFVKHYRENVFSFINRQFCLTEDYKDKRKFVMTKDDIELMKYIEDHKDELLELWEKSPCETSEENDLDTDDDNDDDIGIAETPVESSK